MKVRTKRTGGENGSRLNTFFRQAQDGEQSRTIIFYSALLCTFIAIFFIGCKKASHVTTRPDKADIVSGSKKSKKIAHETIPPAKTDIVSDSKKSKKSKKKERATAPAAETGVISTTQLQQEATLIIQTSLTNENPLVRTNAVEVVAATKLTKLMPKVQRLLRDRLVPVRFAAVLAVGDAQYSLAEPHIIQRLKDRDENVRIAAAYAMGKLGSPKYFVVFRKAIERSDMTVRANAAMLIGKSGDKNALKFLYWALKDKDSDDKVRFNVVQAIAALGDEQIFPKLWAMRISGYADDRVMAIQALGAIGTEKARNVLITMLDDDILEVRLAAAEQLGALKDEIGESVVLDVFEKNLTAGLDKQDLPLVYMRAALAIGRIGTPSLKKYLPQLLKDQSAIVRIAAAKAVLQCAKAK